MRRGLSREDVEDVYRLSPAQQGMLFHCTCRADSTMYLQQFQSGVTPKPLPALFAAAWQRLVDANPVLRTCFLWEGLAEPVQLVARQVDLPVDVQDWSDRPAGEREALLAGYLEEERRRGFDLTRPPLMRLALLDLGERQHLVWTCHHLILDGWSAVMVMREAVDLYQALAAGAEPAPRRRRPFRDYVAWLARQQAAGAEEHFRRLLAGFAAPTPLGIDRPAALESGMGVRELWLAEEETAALRSFAQRHRLTLNTLVNGAWALLLSRYSGEDDVLFGVTLAGRPPALPGVEAMLGCFVNTLPARARLPAGAAAAPWLAALQDEQVKLRRFEHFPLVLVAGLAEVPRQLPLFESVLVFENLPGRGVVGTGAYQRTNYPLVLVAASDSALSLRADYEQARFDEGAVARLLGHLCTLLAAFAAAPEQRLSEISPLTAAERAELLAAGGQPSPAGGEACLHHLFARQAGLRPDAVAAVCGEASLTYGALAARAGRLARRLRRLGVGPEVLVGLLLERSLDMVVAILAVLEAGGAYLPLDARYPEARLRLMMEDAGCAVLVTAGPLRERLGAPGARVLCLDAAADGPAAGPGASRGEAGPDHLAYVIYTSGSTGRPKGALLSHRNLARLFAVTGGWFDFGPTDVWTLFHSFAFDFSVWEMWGALAHGGRLVIVPYPVSRSPREIRALLAREGATVLNQTPSAFRQLVQADAEAPPGDRLPLRLVIFGGEALPPAWLAPWIERHGDERPRLVNMYGITETTVHVTYRPLARADLAAGASPIGVPIPDLQVHVLDRFGNLAPAGVPGEVYVGGAGLGRGYLGRPELTAERFVPDPFAGSAPGGHHGRGARLYRSGDLVRRLPAGELAYLGRADQQVKVRGFRVELGEVEAVVAAHPAVGAAAVLAEPDEAGDGRLLAFFTAAGRRPASAAGRGSALAAELRAHARAHLPEAMVPALFAEVGELPLTAHGKLDRRALLAAAAGPAAGGREPAFVAPRTPVEELLAGLWCDALGRAEVGVHDDFFALGGHSLVLARLLHRTREVLGVELAAQDVFAATTIAALAERIERRRRGGPPAAIERASRDGALPLSFAQERLWFLDQLQPGTAAYNVPAALCLRGSLNASALARALAAVAGRHEALRTVFAADGGRPVQVVHPPPADLLPLADLTALPPARRRAEAAILLAREAYRPFDLAAGPLLRTLLVRVEPDEHLALAAQHHIVSDAWSVGILLREVAALYGAFSRGVPSPLPALPIQYADFAAWQRRWLAGERLEQMLAYWRERLAGVPVLHLPVDRPRPPLQSLRGASRSHALAAEPAARLRTLARRQGATLFMTLLAAFQALLGRLAGQTDFAVGAPVANRGWPEVEPLIGFFVNTLALRADLGGDPPFCDLLARVRAAALAAYAHQDLPFDRVVQEVSPARGLEHAPLFQVLLAAEEDGASGIAMAGLACTPWPVPVATSKFDLSLSFADTPSASLGRALPETGPESAPQRGGGAGSGLALRWAYSTALFDAATVARWGCHLEVLLEAAAQAPGLRLAELPLLGAAERQQALVEWSGIGAGDPDRRLAGELLAAQAGATPEAVAMVAEREHLSYGELAARAAQLARRLSRLGIGPEAVVAVLAERSPEVVAALLATLRAGGAYLPLDPGLPVERLAFLLTDGGAVAVLAQERFLPLAGAALARCGGAGRPVLALDGGAGHSEPAEPTGAETAEPTPAVLPQQPAYVLYTSGSTGAPKGVVVSHRALANRLRYARSHDLAQPQVVLQKTALGFDPSLLEILAPLCSGGTVVLARPDAERDPAYLAALIAERRITHAAFPPGLLAALLDQPQIGGCDSLRWVLTGAEAVPPALPARFYATLSADLLNRYGPTETTVSVIGWPCERGPAPPALPIGRPFAGTRAHVLDGELRPLPPGVVGELYLGGPGLARGYLGRPELTAAAFVPDPFAGIEERRDGPGGALGARNCPGGALGARNVSGGALGARDCPGGALGARLYRTGDLARRRADGAILFVGRADQQVKVRGFRVELGEVERALALHPAVRQVAVIDRAEGEERTLVAYVAPHASGGDASERELREFLAARLPGPMVPSRFVRLPELPVTASGKVDRRALPEPGRRPDEEAGFDPPRGPVEELVAAVWAELLGVARVGRDDDFFDLGGHSLAAARVVMRLRQLAGVELPLARLFKAPTVAGLAAALAAARRAVAEGEGGDAAREPPIERLTGAGPFPLSFAQERLWFLDRLEPGSTAYAIPFALRLAGGIEPAALWAALAGVVRRHAALRTTFGVAAGRPVQRVVPPEAAAMRHSLVDLAGLPAAPREAEARRLAAEAAARPFDLERGPLLRAALLRLGAAAPAREEDRGAEPTPAEHLFLLNLHHIVADAWSVGVMVRELAALYRAALGVPAPLPPAPPLQYADFAVWQRRRLAGDRLAGLLAHWRERLAGAPPGLDLPADRPRAAVPTPRGGSRSAAWPATLTAGLHARGRQAGATLYMTLLAGFAALCMRLTGEEDVVVGTTVAGRDRAELEGLVGFFVNTLPLRVDLAGDPRVGELLGRVRETVLAAFGGQELPFEKLVEELRPRRDATRPPLVQVLFQLQTAPPAALDLPGLPPAPVEAPAQAAKFDLVLSVAERGGTLAASWRYRADLFDAATVERFSRQMERLLGAMAADGEARVAEIGLLSMPERHQLLREWNPPAVEGLPPACLHELFAARAAEHPEAVAASCGAARLSYGELDRRAGRLARALRRAGVAPGVAVGLCVERSLTLPVAVLSVLKAGGAYLPLDPAHPPERTAFALADAAAPVLLTEESLLAGLAAAAGQRRVVLLDAPERTAAGDGARAEPEADLAPRAADPGGIAYVLYTSGSTGRPKGVGVPHACAAGLLAATAAEVGFRRSDVWTLFHSLAFDFSVWELWGALAHGGRLAIVPREVSRSPAALRSLLVEEGVTVLNQTPSAWRQLAGADAALPAGTASGFALRLVIFGGEALVPAWLAPWIERHGDERPRLVNMYGITETTVHATWRPLQGRDAASRQAPGSPVGRPLGHLAIHLLDRGAQPVPLGAPGEIHVGGDGVARGYLGRPELTAARFLPDPFAGRPGSRLYRSGDLARRRPDGELEYLGRTDAQVKVRGFRIELDEVEAALAAAPGVREAAAVAWDPAPGEAGEPAAERRLVACVVPQPGAAPALAALREAAGRTLPDYMLPAGLVLLPELPLSGNGKLDRRALLQVVAEAGGGRARAAGTAPRTELERFLAGLWAEALGAAAVGVDDDFFALGGNSISAAMLVNRLQQELGETVHVVAIFDAPTVAELAGYLAREHPRAVAARWGGAALPGGMPAPAAAGRSLGAAEIAAFRRLAPTLAPPPPEPAAAKNPRAVFVLSPPRSGSTLLRVLLGGHPQLFAPPELELLSFPTLAARRAAFSGRDSFWLEGAIRAVMEARACGVEEARAEIAAGERAGMTTRAFYRRLQGWLGGAVLVDKTPSYALDPAVLARAEEEFAEPFYVHLVRHPAATVLSFEEAKLDQIFFRREHPFARRELAELIWLVSHANILDFLARVPPARQHRVVFEELLAAPRAVVERLSSALGLPFAEAMLRPYAAGSRRMTDGLHAESRMLGDVKFAAHSGIEPAVAERWRRAGQRPALGEEAWRLAAALGYEREGALPPLAPAGWKHGEALPLSFAQERLWLFDQMAPGSPLYNLAAGFRLAGPLDRAALAWSLAEVARRHAVLRTVYALLPDGPAQVVEEAREVPLPVVDLAALPPARREAAGMSLAAEAARRPFDLARGPLLRALLLHLAAGEHAALLALHHIAADGWSMGVLARELTALYAAHTAGRPAALPALPVQYADYALWQRRWLAGEVLEAQLAWWREELAGAPERLDLPLDRPRTAGRSLRGAAHLFLLPEGLAAGLRALGGRSSATLFMVLAGCFQALLARYAGPEGAEDVVVGTPVAGRGRAEIEGLIGFFVNTLVLRLRLGGDPEVGELLRRARAAALGAYAHQDLPFAKLVEALAPRRDLGETPLFQVMVALQSAPAPAPALAGLAVEPLPVATGVAEFDLSLSLHETARGIAGALQFDRDLFDAATAARLAGHFATLLAGAVEAPAAPLSLLPVLTETERLELARWNPQAPAAEAGPRLLHEAFEEQAARQPEATALHSPAGVLTYGELDARAGRLAAELLRRGVGPDVTVALCAEPSAGALAGLLAILLAGGVYVPLPPSLPDERLRALLADCGARALLTSPALAGRLAPLAATCGVPLVDLARPRAGAGRRAPRGAALPESLCYVLYTSGSTGVPKGVGVEHRAASPHLQGMLREYALCADDRLLQTASWGFDIAIEEILAPLAGGAALVDAGGEPWALDRLEERIAELGVTILDPPPAVLRPWVERLAEDGGETPPATPLRLVITGGEALPAEVARLWPKTRLAARARLINGYGPTEAVITATVHDVPAAGPPAALARVPIGRPVAGHTAHVLDRRGERVPVGVAGELALGGHLARGYLGRPAATAERFVPDPFAAVPGARLYRTGDLVHHRPGGELEFLGRLDQQVKIRGHRVEPGEVEAALARHPRILQAAVVARGEEDRRLVAYLVPRAGGAAPGAGELRAWLAARLPEPMVPAAFVVLAALPLTANGKLDVGALPEPAREAAAGHARPESHLEELLAGIWSELLGVGPVGADDDFFALGGHSLAAIQLASRLRRGLGVELPLRRIFERPTLAALAREIEAAGRARRGFEPPPLARAAEPGAPPLSFAQERLWFLDRLQPGTPAYNLPSALRLKGALDRAALAASLCEIARRHETLRTTFAEREGRLVQVIAPAPRLPLPLVDLAALPAPARAGEVRRLADEEGRRSFDLAAGPLLRAALLATGGPEGGEHVLLLTMHHIVADGWSAGVLVRELAALYPALAAGAPSPLPELPVQYADFARWQRGWLRGEALAALVEFWRAHLAGAPPLLALPTDRPRPPVQRPRGATRRATLPAALAARLGAVCRGSAATLFMGLLAVFQAVLSRLSGRPDPVVGTPVAGRDRLELEPLVGFFVNALALRADLAGEPSFRSLLARTRELALAAYAHQDLPFEKLVEELAPERSLAHSPLFQVMFALQTSPLPALALPGLEVSLLASRGSAAKFDLSVNGQEVAGGLAFLWHYDRDLFDGATIERLAGHFSRLAEAAAADPEAPVAALPWLGQAERHQLLAEWNDGSGCGEVPCLHESLAACAAAAPDAAAASCGEEWLTYGELDRRAEALARRLAGAGVRPGDVVALCLERSLDLVLGVAGALKAGAAYLPLDPAHPRERLSFMLSDGGARALVAGSRAADLAGTGGAVPVVDLAGIGGAVPIVDLARERVALAAAAGPDAPAYVIYTSGSTGTPKGVAVSHRSAARLFAATATRFGFDREDVWTLFHSYAFDFSVWEMWGALAHGGRLVVVPWWTSRSPEAFHALLAEQRVTVLSQTPSAFRQLLWADEAGGGDLALSWVVFGGEVLDAGMLAPWFARHGDRRPRLVNLYGITEATVHVTWRPLDAEDARAARGSVVGRPLPDLRLHVLDAGLRPQPIGVPGELYVGGAGLARGYLGRPTLTAERFLPDPFAEGPGAPGARLVDSGGALGARPVDSGGAPGARPVDWDGAPGARLYRTGDLGRRLADGEVEYLGRIDQQVKVRGFRIELGEIEAALAAHPAVHGAAVLARGDGGEPRLVAYVAGEGSAAPPAAELRRFLGERLPDYMVPAIYVPLPALPLTANGKVDRRALPAPEEADGGRAAWAPARTALERYLCNLWQETLGVPRVGVEDDFFALGGSSISGAVLIGRLQREIGEIIHVVVIFDAPTVAALAVYLASQHGEAVARRFGREALAPDTPAVSAAQEADSDPRPRPSRLVALQPRGERPPFVCLHPGGGTVHCYAELARELGPDQPFYGIQALGLNAGEEVLAELGEIAGRALDELLRFAPAGPYRLGGWSFGGFVAYEMACRLAEAGREIELLALFDADAGALGQLAPLDDCELLAQAFEPLPLSAVELAALAPERRLPHVVERARAAGGLWTQAAEIDLDQARRYLAVYAANREAMRTWRPRPYPGRIALFRAEECPASPATPAGDGTLGWSRLAAAMEIYPVPGRHRTMMSPPFVGHLCRRLEACLAAPPPLSAAQRHQLLAEWNDSAAPAPAGATIGELFAAQAARDPGAVAVCGRGERLTYGELDARAGRLARHLRGLGVGPEVPVAVCLPRSFEMAVAVLAVVKAGGAYLPVDPAYPEARRTFLLEDSGARLLLAPSALAPAPPGFHGRVIAVAAAEREAAALAPGGDPAPGMTTENLLYVIYTSGSTGRPKGVMVPHRALVHHVAAVVQRYPIGASDRMLQLASLCFDVAAEELFAAWLAGATAVLAPSHALDSPAELLATIGREGVTICGLTASYWHALVAEVAAGGLAVPECLRLLIVGAEPVSAERLEAWRQAVGDRVQVWNAYGPSEATVQATLHEPPRQGERRRGPSVPIGRPLGHARIYLLDERRAPVPAGAAGEVYIGGPGVARGYLRRPERTAERFLPDPFGGEPGARLYRTGDLCRHLADGELEFLCRTDDQVKVRGHRIEPGEIEAALRRHPRVADAVVVARECAMADPDDAEALAAGLAALAPEEAERLLAEAETPAETEPAEPRPAPRAVPRGRDGHFRRRTPGFEISLALAHERVVATPAPRQRSWLLNQVLDEAAAEIDHLDRIAGTLVPGSPRAAIESRWQDSAARYDGRQLQIEGQQVMQEWERPLMRAMAEVVAAAHGDVLEVGFGMGISATYIQELGVRSHTIVECNEGVVDELERWRRRYPGRDIRLIQGKWQEVTERLGAYDGVFFDTYHTDEKEYVDHVLSGATFAEHFFPSAAACLRSDGVFTYYSNEIDSLSRRHQRRVLAYFRSLALSVVRPLRPPPDCNYWWADSMVVVKAVK